jgi:hypothetical protein
MLYTRFVIGEETLSSTRACSFSHPPDLLNRNQFVDLVSFCCPLLGIIGYLNISSAERVQQGKFATICVNCGNVGAHHSTKRARASRAAHQWDRPVMILRVGRFPARPGNTVSGHKPT